MTTTPPTSVQSREEVIASGAGLQPMTNFLHLLDMAVENHATDLYIRCGAPLVFRAGGELQYAVNWGVGDKGVVEKKLFLAMLAPLSKNAISAKPAAFSTVVPFKGWQARVQYSPLIEPAQLMVRIQPEEPYSLDSYLKESPKTVHSLQGASGLILVCGPIGSGKTSLLSSIIESWAGNPTAKGARHVVQMGDPVEYRLNPERYIVSTIECALTEAGRTEERPFISDIIPHVLRSDIDALAVGEIREAKVLRSCMEFSAAREPVVSTIHAASIADCIVRTLGMAEQVLSPATARLMLAACLEGVFFINIAYSSKGVAVPVVEYQPMQTVTMRNTIAHCGAKELVSQIEQAQTQGQRNDGSISRAAAIKAARDRGLSETEAVQALGKLSSQDAGRLAV